jgi:beta-glucanase (GH16 family)
MKKSHLRSGLKAAILSFCLVLSQGCGPRVKTHQPSPPPAPPTASSKWILTWNDEFDAADGSGPDSSKWEYAVGGSGWGNKEFEYYTSRPQNAHIEDGKLVITALRENYTGLDGVTRQHTSARLITLGKFSQAYGRFEARIKIPRGQGMWPAFWMLGQDQAQIGWPRCGEIDIMENIGKEPSTIHGTLHGPAEAHGGHEVGSPYTLRQGAFADDYHVYGVEWEPKLIRFYVDNSLYETRTPADFASESDWVFDHDFYLLLNLAVGGRWPGDPDQTTVFPQKMLVDYVRVYRRP